jgi:hypothetical protein
LNKLKNNLPSIIFDDILITNTG